MPRGPNVVCLGCLRKLSAKRYLGGLIEVEPHECIPQPKAAEEPRDIGDVNGLRDDPPKDADIGNANEISGWK